MMQLRKSYILVLMAASAVCSFAHAQDRDYYNGDDLEDEVNETTEKYTPWWRKYTVGENLPNDGDKAEYFDFGSKEKYKLFNKVITIKYIAADSIDLKRKKLQSTKYSTFNAADELVYNLETDGNGNKTDSRSVTYDANHLELLRLDSAVSMDGVRRPHELDYFIRNKEDRVITDSTVFINYVGQEMEKSSTLSRYTYDADGNVQQQMNFNYDDTNSIVYVDDRQQRITYTRLFYSGKWKITEFKRYNEHNLPVEVATTHFNSDSDTGEIKLTYDGLDRVIKAEKYRMGVLVADLRVDFKADSSRVVTEQSYGEHTGQSCPNIVKTVTLYNPLDLPVSKVENRQTEGIVVTTNHYYKMQDKQVLLDSEVSTTEGELVTKAVLRLTYYSYDKNGNMTNKTVRAAYGENSKEEWVYDAGNRLLIDDMYDNCGGAPYSSMHYTYYPSGSVKTYYHKDVNQNEYYFYNSDGLKTRTINIRKPDTYTRNYVTTETIYKYEK